MSGAPLPRAGAAPASSCPQPTSGPADDRGLAMLPRSLLPAALALALLLSTPATAVAHQQTPAPSGLDHILYRPLRRDFCTAFPAPFASPRNHSCLALPPHPPGPRLSTDAGLAAVLARSAAAALPRAAAPDERAAAAAAGLPPPAPPPGPADVVALFYGGAWCVWSNALRPAWAAAAARFPHLCTVAVDASAHPAANAGHGVHAFPTVLAFCAGAPRARYAGDRTVEDLVAWLAGVSGVAPLPPGDADPRALSGDWVDAVAGRGDPALADDWLLVASCAVTAAAAAVGLRALTRR